MFKGISNCIVSCINTLEWKHSVFVAPDCTVLVQISLFLVKLSRWWFTRSRAGWDKAHAWTHTAWLRLTSLHTNCALKSVVSASSHTLTHTYACIHTLRPVLTGAGMWKRRDTAAVRHMTYRQKNIFTHREQVFGNDRMWTNHTNHMHSYA